MADVRRRVLIVVASRGQAIRMAPIYWALACHPWLEPAVVSVANDDHALIAEALAAFAIAPDHELSLAQTTAVPAEEAATALSRVDRLLATARPALVVTQGACPALLTTMLAAVHRDIPVAWLDDANAPRPAGHPCARAPLANGTRLVASRLASLRVTTTAAARAEMIAGGIPADRVIVAGSTVGDALTLLSRCRDRRTPPGGSAPDHCPGGAGPLLLIALAAATARTPTSLHEEIATAVLRLLARFPDLRVIWPMIRDPLTAASCERRLAGHVNVVLAPPLRYDRFIDTLRAAEVVLTDSATIEEEARALGRPLLVLNETEKWLQAMAARVERPVMTPSLAIEAAVARLLADPQARRVAAEADPRRAAVPPVPRLLAGLETLVRGEAAGAAA